MNKRGTSILSSNFIREISNVFQRQCILRSPSGEFDASSAEYKSKGNEINHSKPIRKINLNKFVVAYLNINLRILTGKKHRQIKLQYLEKVQIWAFALLMMMINCFCGMADRVKA